MEWQHIALPFVAFKRGYLVNHFIPSKLSNSCRNSHYNAFRVSYRSIGAMRSRYFTPSVSVTQYFLSSDQPCKPCRHNLPHASFLSIRFARNNGAYGLIWQGFLIPRRWSAIGSPCFHFLSNTMIKYDTVFVSRKTFAFIYQNLFSLLPLFGLLKSRQKYRRITRQNQ